MPHTGNVQPALDNEEHLHAAKSKRVAPYFLQENGQYANVVSLPRSRHTLDSLFTAVTVTDTPTLLADFNGDRRQLILSKSTDGSIWVGPRAADLTSTNGIWMRQGDRLVDAGADLYQGQWWAIRAAGASDQKITVIELEA